MATCPQTRPPHRRLAALAGAVSAASALAAGPMESPSSAPSPTLTLASRLVLPCPSAGHPQFCLLSACDGAVQRLTAQPLSVEDDGAFIANYEDPGAGAAVLILFSFAPAHAPQTRWLAAVEPGRFEFRWPGPGSPFAEGNASLPFLPSRDGFRFVNHFTDAPAEFLSRIAGLQLDAYGLCGGMSSAAADLFLAGRPRPDAATPPRAGSPFFRYITQRQVDSLGPLAVEGLRFGHWMSLPFAAIGGTNHRTLDQLAAARRLIDAGRPAILGLNYVAAGPGQTVWQNHQVLAFAYSASGNGQVTVRIYDPNFPGRDDISLELHEQPLGAIDDPWAPGESIEIRGVECRQWAGSRPLRKVRGFFVMPYEPAAPPADLSAEPSPAPSQSGP